MGHEASASDFRLRRPDPRQCVSSGRESVGADAFDHRAHAVGALRRQMLLEAEFAERRQGVRGDDLLGRAVGEKRDRDRDQPAHEMRIAVAAKVQNRLAGRVPTGVAFEPNLADAAANLVGVVVRGLAQRLERAAELDDVAIAVLPFLEEGEIGADGFDRGQRRALREG